MKTEEAAARVLINLPTLRRHRRVTARRARLQRLARPASNGRVTHYSVEKINYPGSGNFTTFMFDPLSRNVKVAEVLAGLTTSTRNFVWSDDSRCEERDTGGTVARQFFIYGERIGGSDYYYATNHLGSTSETTDNSGHLQSRFEYDPYGRVSLLEGVFQADFQFADYYFHNRSALNLPIYRAYNSTLGRWLSRDPIQELGGLNLYAYVRNSPVSAIDPSGLKQSWQQCIDCCDSYQRLRVKLCNLFSPGSPQRIWCLIASKVLFVECRLHCAFDHDACKLPIAVECNPFRPNKYHAPSQ